MFFLNRLIVLKDKTPGTELAQICKQKMSAAT